VERPQFEPGGEHDIGLGLEDVFGRADLVELAVEVGVAIEELHQVIGFAADPVALKHPDDPRVILLLRSG